MLDVLAALLYSQCLELPMLLAKHKKDSNMLAALAYLL